MGLLLLMGGVTFDNPRTDFFARGEQGLWLDPSQMSTLYEDSNGVTPCTAAGDQVGLILDQSRGGLGALGAQVWNHGSVITAGDSQIISSQVYRIYSSAGSYAAIQVSNLLTVGKWYRISFTVDSVATAGSGIQVQDNGAIFTTTGDKVTIHRADDVNLFIKRRLGATDYQISNISVREVPGNHAYQTTSAARPTLQTSGGLWYLSFDGSDDSLTTNSVDMTGTAQMTVIAGVRKLSDAAVGIVAELSAGVGANDGAFASYIPSSNGYGIQLRGNLASPFGVSAGQASPTTNVVSWNYDIGQSAVADEQIMRINGIQQSLSFSGIESGSGNFGNYALYIGRRGGSSLPFNGHLYQLIVRGTTTPTAKLLEAERFVGRKTGVSF